MTTSTLAILRKQSSVIAILGMSSCVTPQQKKQMDDDIYRLQTRMLQLESSFYQGKTADQKTGDLHHKALAATSTDIERLSLDLKRIRGEIDTLKVGVVTGQLPGQEASQETSIASQLSEIRTRLETVEQNQKELMTAVESNSNQTRKPNDKREISTGSSHADPESLKTAYARKHFKEVAEDAPSVLKSAKGKEREEVLLLYGESLLKLNRPKEAALQFNELVELNPGAKIMAQAKLRLGDAFKSMGDKETSKLFYEEVITKFPGTPESEKAKKSSRGKK